VLLLAWSTAGAVLLWSTPVAPPRWSELTSLSRPPTGLLEAIGFGLWCASVCACSYLAVAAALHLVASACERRGAAPGLRRWIGRATPRWLTVASVGVVAGSTLLAPTAGAATGGERRDDVRLEVVDQTDTAGPRTMLPWALTTTTALPGDVAATTTSTSALPADPPRLVPERDDQPRATPGPEQLPPPLVIERESAAPHEHTVAPGEHFWSIAERTVAERGSSVTVDDYWRLLVEVNRDRLADPDDPDLIYPGQVLVLP
jgi:hypothetical protein